MDLQDIVKNIIKSGKTELFAQPGKFLEEIRKQCRSETDAVMYIQFRILLDLNRNFVNALYLSAKDGSYCGAVEKLSAFYDGKKIPARVYAYFIYAVLNGCGVATDKAEWFDPLTDKLDASSAPKDNLTFGTGAYAEDISEFEPGETGDVLKKFKGKRALVTVPEGYRAIGGNAFEHNQELQWITVPNSVTEIGREAFQDCGGLETAVFSSNLTQIPDKCFYGAEKLSLVVAPNVREVGQKAFCMTNLSNFRRIGNGRLEKIGAFAFSRCKKLTKLDLSECKSVSRGAFAECTGIRTLTLTDGVRIDEQNLLSLFSKNADAYRSSGYLLEEVIYRCDKGEIPPGFFADCSSVKKITVLGEVRKLGERAFAGCSALTELSMEYVGQDLPDSAFRGCEGLVCLPEFSQVERIGEYAFSGCTQLKSLNFKKVLSVLGKGAFSGCANLQSLNLSFERAEIASECFKGCPSLKDIAVDQVRLIGREAFVGCKFLKGLHLTEATQVIEEAAFRGAEIGGTLTVPAGIAFGKRVFEGIKGVRDLVLYSTSVRDSAGNAFPLCELFAENAEQLASSFEGLKNIKILADNVVEGAFEGWANIKKVLIASPLGSIGKNAFRGCTSLEGVKIDSDRVQIGESAFADCTSLQRFKTSSQSVPDEDVNLFGVLSVGFAAFEGCSFEKISLPFTCKTENGAFASCGKLKEIVFYCDAQAAPPQIFAPFAESKEEFNARFSACTKVVFRGLRAVPDEFFDGYKNIREIVFDGEIEKIGRAAFANLPALEKVSGSYVGDILPESVFENCASLSEIFSMKNVGKIQPRAFQGCSSLCSVFFGTVVEIGDFAFCGCASLTEFGGNFSGKWVGAYAFSGCKKLGNFGFLSDVTDVREFAFENTSIGRIPETIRFAARGAFKNANLGDTVTIPAGVRFEEGALEDICDFKTLVLEGECVKDREDKEIPLYRLFAQSLESFNEKYFLLANVRVEKGLVAEEFCGWKKIRKVLISAGDEVSIPASCFDGCESLEGIKVAGTVRSIGEFAFRNCISLKRFKTRGTEDCDLSLQKVGSIGRNAFENCASVREISFVLSSVSEGAFSGCDGTERIKVRLDGGSGKICSAFSEEETFGSRYPNLKRAELVNTNALPSGLLAGCGNLKEIVCADRVEKAGEGVFRGCFGLETLVWDFAGTQLPAHCFEDCRSLSSPMSFEKVSEIGISAFRNCEKLTEIKFLSPVYTLGEEAFASCGSLTAVQMNFAGKVVPARCFAQCASLSVLPEMREVGQIGEDAFFGCGKISHLCIGCVKGERLSFLFGDSCQEIRSVEYTSDYIADNFFNGMSSLEEVKFCKEIVHIGDSAFYGTQSLKGGFSFQSAEYVGRYAFAYSGIEEIRFSDTLKGIGVGVFAGCRALRDLEMPACFRCFGSLFDWKKEQGTEEVVQKCSGRDKKYYLPRSLRKAVITGGCLSEGMFSGLGCEVDIRFAPREIPDHAFAGFRGKLRMDVSQVVRLGVGAFENLKSDEPALELPEIVSVGAGAFAGAQLCLLTLGKNLREIGDNAFLHAEIREVRIGGGSVYAAENSLVTDKNSGKLLYAGKGISGEIFLDGRVTEIEPYAFADCKNITSVKAVDVRRVGERAFENCTSLLSVVLSEKAERIGGEICRGCENILYLELPFLGERADAPSAIGYVWGDAEPKKQADIVVKGGKLAEGVFCSDAKRRYGKIDLARTDCKILDRDCFVNAEIQELILPEQLKSVQPGSFRRCRIDRVTVLFEEEKADGVSVTEGCIYSGNALIYRFRDGGALKIARGTKVICQDAFDLCSRAEQLSVSDEELLTGSNIALIGGLEGVSELEISADVSVPMRKLFGKYAKNLVKICYSESNSCIDMFAGLTSLKELLLPGVRVLQKGFFSGCDNLQDLTSFRSLESIEKGAFDGLSEIKLLQIPQTIRKIAPESFDGTDVRHLIVEKNDSYSCEHGLLTDARKNLLYAEKDLKGAVQIGDVLTIRKSAFRNCTLLTEVRIGILREIGDLAFEGCVNLRHFSVKNCEKMGKGVLSGCQALASLEIPYSGPSKSCGKHLLYLFNADPEEYGTEKSLSLAVEKCFPPSLRDVTLLGQTVIDGTFSMCDRLEAVTLPGPTRSVRTGAFKQCTSLKKVTLSDSVREVENFAFFHCGKGLLIEIADKAQEESFSPKWNHLNKGVFGIGVKKAKVKYRR